MGEKSAQNLVEAIEQQQGDDAARASSTRSAFPTSASRPRRRWRAHFRTLEALIEAALADAPTDDAALKDKERCPRLRAVADVGAGGRAPDRALVRPGPSTSR